jgi:PAS domain S-box-containing protein
MENQELSKSENFLRLVIDNIPQAIFWKDRHSNYLGCNRNFADDAGLETPESIVGKNDYDLPWTKEEADWYRECDRRIMDSDSPEYHILETQQRADGQQTWLETNKIPLHDREGKVVGILGTYEDITSRKQTEAALESQLQKTKLLSQITQAIRQSLNTQKIFQTAVTQIRELLKADRVGIYKFDPDSNCAEGEFVAEDVLAEYDSALAIKVRDRCLGEDCAVDYRQGKVLAIADIYNANLSDCHINILARFQIRANLVIPLLQGNELWGLLCIYQCSRPRQWQEEEIQFVQKIATQLSVALDQAQLLEREKEQRVLLDRQNKQLREAKEKADAANRAKSQFLANMSHELRTPLNAILGFTQVMKRDSLLNEKHQEFLDTINRSGEHLLQLINDILEMSKIEAGQIEFHETSFDLYALVSNLEDMFYLKANSKALDFVVDIDSSIPQYIKTDQGKLNQVLINLIGNAIKFTEKGSVTLQINKVSCQESANENISVLFSVEDTGLGIAPEEIDQLFAAFGQTATGRKAKEGTGLGLSISQKFVQLMHGDIIVSSRLAGGTIFSFEIPIRLAQAEIVQTDHSQPKVIALEPGQPQYRILVVDDRLESRQVLVHLLTPLGFQIKEAANGQEAVEIWSSWQPHLIWMDMRMPVMDGYEATKRIKAHVKGQATAIIALTASVFEEEKTIILSAGCDDFLRKPLRATDLFEKMAKHLGVRYIYEEPTLLVANEKILQESKIPEELESLSVELLTQLNQAAEIADDLVLTSLIEQISSEYSSLAAVLEDWLRQYRVDKIADLTKQALSKK